MVVVRRWLAGQGPPIAAAVALAVAGAVAVATPSLGAGDRRWDPAPCSTELAEMAPALVEPVAADPHQPRPDGWFTLDPILDDGGTLTGRRLRMGLGDARRSHVDLPAESSAAGPFGRLLLVTADDGRRSVIRLVDRQSACWWLVGESADVVRGVTFDVPGSAVLEHRVDRRTRADVGVWRRPLDGGPPTRLVEPLPADPAFGRTWSTTLGWSLDGRRLVVQSCAAIECRTRVVDPAQGDGILLDGPGTGPALGLAGDQLVAYEACDALPCPIRVIDTRTRAVRRVLDAAGRAVLTVTATGPRIAAETPDGPVALAPDGHPTPLAAPPDGALRLVPGVVDPAAGAGLPAGWLAWSPDGRSPDGAVLTRLDDGRVVIPAEVLP